jgi:hypothetical protein
MKPGAERHSATRKARYGGQPKQKQVENARAAQDSAIVSSLIWRVKGTAALCSRAEYSSRFLAGDFAAQYCRAIFPDALRERTYRANFSACGVHF